MQYNRPSHYIFSLLFGIALLSSCSRHPMMSMALGEEEVALPKSSDKRDPLRGIKKFFNRGRDSKLSELKEKASKYSEAYSECQEAAEEERRNAEDEKRKLNQEIAVLLAQRDVLRDMRKNLEEAKNDCQKELDADKGMQKSHKKEISRLAKQLKIAQDDLQDRDNAYKACVSLDLQEKGGASIPLNFLSKEAGMGLLVGATVAGGFVWKKMSTTVTQEKERATQAAIEKEEIQRQLQEKERQLREKEHQLGEKERQLEEQTGKSKKKSNTIARLEKEIVKMSAYNTAASVSSALQSEISDVDTLASHNSVVPRSR